MRTTKIYQDYDGNNFFIVDSDSSIILCIKIDDEFCSTTLYALEGQKNLRANEKAQKYFHGNHEISKTEYEKIKEQYLREIDSYKENAEIDGFGGIGWLVLELKSVIGSWEI